MDEIHFLRERIAGYFVWLHGAEAMDRLRTELDRDAGFYSTTRRALRLCLIKQYAEGTLTTLVRQDFGHGECAVSDEAARLWLRQMFSLLFAAQTQPSRPVSSSIANPTE